jgi:TRAP transporter TAXI family solute receptor
MKEKLMFKTLLMTAIILASSLVGSSYVSAKTYNLTLSGASPGGLWSRIGTGVDAAIAQAYPGSTVTYQPSSGGFANAVMVSKGKVPMGIISDSGLTVAIKGSYPLKKPVTDLRVLFRLYQPESRFQQSFLAVTKKFADKHNIKSFNDAVNKKLAMRVVVNIRGAIDTEISKEAMAGFGISESIIKSWGGQIINAAAKEAGSLLGDGRADVLFLGVSFNHPYIRQMVKHTDLVLLEYGPTVANRVATKFGASVCGVKPGEYKWAPTTNVTTICHGAVVIVNKNMSNQQAYNITKAMVEQIESYKNNSHRLIKKTATPAVLAGSGNAPSHPGALNILKKMD